MLLTLKRIVSRPDGTFGVLLPLSTRPTLNEADGALPMDTPA